MPAISLPQRATSTTGRQRLKGPLLVATDGTAQSAGAFAAAVCIANAGTRLTGRTSKLPVEVVTVCETLPISSPDMAVPVPGDIVEGRRAQMLGGALAQVRYNVADMSNWKVDAMSGPPAPTIAIAAVEKAASLVVMGLGKHELIDRVFGSETALRVIQLSRVPVLAVPENWIGVPRRVVVAVDFGPASLRAARTAMRIVASGGTVCFAHVATGVELPECDEELAEIYQSSLHEEFDRFIDAVGVPDDITVTRTQLYGETSRALLVWAREHSADMIVAGTHGVNAFARLLVGSVARKLVRGAHCAVLIASAQSDSHDCDHVPLPDVDAPVDSWNDEFCRAGIERQA